VTRIARRRRPKQHAKERIMRKLRCLVASCLWLAAAPAFAATATESREQGHVEYERGHYAAAAGHFREAATQGDARSAEILVLMHRYSATLYGGQLSADAGEVARWAAIAAEARCGASAAAATARLPDAPR
jgi:hypothetical protein